MLDKPHSNTWGGFEDDYKNLLISLIRGNEQKPNNLIRNYTVAELNKELAEIVALFNKYLFEEIKIPNTFDSKIFSKLFTKPIKKWRMSDTESWVYGRLPEKEELTEPELNHILFLSFNYTDTIQRYLFSPENRERMKRKLGIFFEDSPVQTSLRYIHGHLSDTPESIIFGHGDELDENQAILEKMK